MKIDWNNLFKIRIANSDKSMLKHEVVKLILLMKLMEKNKKKRNWIRVYSEFELSNRLRCDVYFEDIKAKSAIAFEIQKDYSLSWLKRQTNLYKDWEVPYMKTSDWIPIPLNKLSNDVNKIWEELEEYL